MSDFLSNLVTRNLKPDPAIKPRLPSRFEPVQPSLGGSPGPGFEPDSVEEVSQTRETRPAPPWRAARRDQASIESEPRLYPAMRAEPTPRITPMPDVSPVLPEAAPVVTQAAPQILPRERSIRRPSLRVEEPAPPSRSELRIQSPEANPEIQASPLLVERQITLERLIVERPAMEPTETPAAHRPAGDARLESPDRPPRILVQPQIRPAPEKPTGQRAPKPGVEPAAEPAPVIHVTIGRVEVKATPPPQPARRSTPARPVMGLEEYLNRPKRGQR